MFTTAPLFGKFHSPLKNATQPLRSHRPLHHLEALCAPWMTPSLLEPNSEKTNSRQRIYTPKLTFLTFLDQVLNPGSSCRHAVRQVQAYYQSLPQPRTVSADDSPEWPLVKAQNFLTEAFASRRIGQSFKDDSAAEGLHFV